MLMEKRLWYVDHCPSHSTVVKNLQQFVVICVECVTMTAKWSAILTKRTSIEYFLLTVPCRIEIGISSESRGRC